MTEWFCPDTSQFSVMNIPQTYNDGQQFRLVVDYCNEDEPNCESDEEKRLAYLNQVVVQSKVVWQYFNKEQFMETKKLTYASAEDMISGLLPGQCITKQFSTFKHELQVFNNKIFDYSILEGLFSSRDFRRYTLFFENTIPMPFRRMKDRALTSGVYQHVYNQNFQLINEQKTIISFDVILSYLGGYVSAIYVFFATLT